MGTRTALEIIMAIRKQENEIYNKNGFVVLDKFIEYETSLILFHHVMMSARRAQYVQINEPDLFDDEKQHYGYFHKCYCLSKPVWNKPNTSGSWTLNFNNYFESTSKIDD
jgi:hypothetical protein